MLSVSLWKINAATQPLFAGQVTRKSGRKDEREPVKRHSSAMSELRELYPSITEEAHDRCNAAIIRGKRAIEALQKDPRLTTAVNTWLNGEKARHKLISLDLFPPTQHPITQKNYDLKKQLYPKQIAQGEAAWSFLRKVAPDESIRALEEAQKAKDEIAQGHIRLAYDMAVKAYYHGDWENLGSDGIVKLREVAHTTYDPENLTSNRFSTIATITLRQFYPAKIVALNGLPKSDARFIPIMRQAAENLREGGISQPNQQQIFEVLLSIRPNEKNYRISFRKFQGIADYLNTTTNPLTTDAPSPENDEDCINLTKLFTPEQLKFLCVFIKHKPPLPQYLKYKFKIKEDGHMLHHSLANFEIARKLRIDEKTLPKIHQKTLALIAKVLKMFRAKPNRDDLKGKTTHHSLAIQIAYFRACRKSDVKNAIRQLSKPKAQQIAALEIFGDESANPLPKAEIGQLLEKKICPERVRQYLRKSLPQVFANLELTPSSTQPEESSAA